MFKFTSFLIKIECISLTFILHTFFRHTSAFKKCTNMNKSKEIMRRRYKLFLDLWLLKFEETSGQADPS